MVAVATQAVADCSHWVVMGAAVRVEGVRAQLVGDSQVVAVAASLAVDSCGRCPKVGKPWLIAAGIAAAIAIPLALDDNDAS